MPQNPPRSSFPRHILKVLLWTFIATVSFAFVSESVVRRLEAVGLAVFLLILIIAIHILFDIVGIAAAAASEAPLNAMAARKVTGALEGLFLVKNADKVANFTNDVVGDVTGTVAGALGISLMSQVLLAWPEASELWLNILVTAAIASVTVAGKAVGKRIAITQANQVIFLAGRLIAGYQRIATPFFSRKGKSLNKKVRKFERS